MDKAEEVKARERSKNKRERDQGVNRIIFQQKRQQLPKYLPYYNNDVLCYQPHIPSHAPSGSWDKQ